MPNNTVSTRRTLFAVAGSVAAATLLTGAGSALAQDESAAIAKAVESLRVAMFAGDGAALKALTMDQMTYGHSNGRLEDKAAFVASLEGKKAFESLTFSDHTIQIVGDNAVARHTFDASNILPDGKTSPAHIKVLQVWKKDGGAWKLLARQSAPLPN